MEEKKSLFYISIHNLIKILVIPILILFIFSNCFIIKYAMDGILGSNKALSTQITDSTNNNLDLISVIAANISSNSKIHTLMNNWYVADTSYDKSRISTDINSLISANISNMTYYQGVVFNLKDGSKYVYGNPNHSEELEILSKESKYKDNRVSMVNDYIYDKEVVLILPIRNRATIIDNMILVIDEKMFINKNSLNKISLEDMLIKKDIQKQSNIKNVILEKGKLYYRDISKLQKFNLSIILQYDLTPVLNLIVKLILMFIVGTMLISILLIIYYRKYKTMILDPISKTVASINYIRKKGELQEVFEENDIKEIDSLNSYLNKMIRDIKILIKENQKINEEKLTIEINALQSQITPHFIFNTLNSIRIQAMINDDKEVANSIKDFSSLIKNNFTKGNIHSFIDEIRAIENYLNIMKLRYGDKIKSNITIQEEIKDKKVLKLIIQPVIENSIIHGLAVKDYNGIITIKVYARESKVIVEVKDDGSGISEDKINEVLSGEGSGIGIFNSNRRVKVYYGEEYGISIESEEGKYTKTTIVLPDIQI